jgi:HSP20 family molecular chaperone IbpA
MAVEKTMTKAEPADVVRRREHEQYFQPVCDILERPDAVVLRFDMPGVAKENVDITVDKDLMTVTGQAEPEESGNVVYRETQIGPYRRQFTLSSDLDPNHIAATMADGVLTVEVGKAEQAKPRKIEVTADD